ncbi:Winged helix-turn-helix DNA-binding [Haladaptatus litoreus]|uniref:Winged helix-turn-helix DNA-binding n=1 Tax=Haladaptatus litoreus TaxID=553468 RepID=A0A1N6XVV9_9EURY|nr:winged helix-turn-helix domain-containing protein [Haladaptatus litoreus]SIR06480.1 Winged helix-turn-helix DNA-binding [Haladaptatus litoreus]
MSGDDSDNGRDDRNDTEDTGDEVPVDTGDAAESTEEMSDEKPLSRGRKRLGEEADKAVEGFDQGIVDLLSWVLDTETRARIYVYLRKHPGSTSEEIAEGTGLYPSTVRESLAELHEEEKVVREKRESAGAGNNPYEYTAIAPSELVGGIVDQVQGELNTVFNLDNHLNDEESRTEPVSIEVEDISDDMDRKRENEYEDSDEGLDTTEGADEDADDESGEE